MDIFLIIYCLLFLLIILAPSLLVFWKYKSQNTSLFGASPDEFTSNLKEERLILLSNLADLKAEQETGKMKQGEFHEFSKEIIQSLASIDDRLTQTSISNVSDKNSVFSNKESTNTEGSVYLENKNSNTSFNFCPECGTQLIASAKFCHSCGYKITN